MVALGNGKTNSIISKLRFGIQLVKLNYFRLLLYSLISLSRFFSRKSIE